MKRKDADSRPNMTRRGFLKLGGSAACTAGLGALAVASGSLLAPETAYATVEGDQTMLTPEQIAEAEEKGLIATEPYVDASVPSPMSADSKAVRTIGGALRYDTSALQAQDAWPSGSEWVIIASGESYSDSICSGGLAGSLACPILLVSKNNLPASISNEIKALGASHAIILGGTDVISASVEYSIRGLIPDTTRLWGATRYDTQVAVYQYGLQHGLWGNTAIIAYGENFADALAVSPLSYKLKAPVFYVGGSGSLPESQLSAIMSSTTLSSFIIAGGTTVVPQSVETQLKQKGTVTRLGGPTRYETSDLIAQYAVQSAGMTWDGMAIASGEVPFDALGGGAAQGRNNSVLILRCDNGGNYQSKPTIPCSRPASIRFYGGNDVFSGAYKARLALSAGYTIYDIENFLAYIDAGHGRLNNGAYDGGASSGSYVEHNLTQDLANRVANQLRSRGVQVYVNSNNGEYKLHNPEALRIGAAVLVSIHFNAGGGTGTESYIHTYHAAYGAEQLRSAIHPRLVRALGLRDRGKFCEQWAVTGGRVPGTLLEICFIDNGSDMNTYNSRRDAVASAIAEGIVNIKY